MGGEYRIRDYLPDDKTEIIQLVGTVWGNDFSKGLNAIWDWKYGPRGMDQALIPQALVMEKEGAVVGCLSLMAVPIKMHGLFTTAIWLGDYVVHPAHRGRGQRLLLKAQELPYLVLGTPNPVSCRIAKTIGFVDVCTISNKVYIVNMDKVLADARGNRTFFLSSRKIWKGVSKVVSNFLRPRGKSEVSIVATTRFDDEFDSFWAETSEAYDIAVLRDQRYLNWRFVDCPIHPYTLRVARHAGKVCGYIVFRSEKTEKMRYGHIVDFYSDRRFPESTYYLFSAAMEELIDAGADVITCYISSRDVVSSNMLRRLGFFFDKPKGPVLLYRNKNVFPSDGVVETGTCFFTRGDSDLDLYFGDPGLIRI